MSKRFNPNLVKIHRNYTVEDVARLLSVHKNTVREWIKKGLTVNDDKTPTLILGSELKSFLQAKRVKHKQKCQPHEIYCVRCRTPQKPAENMADYQAINTSIGRLIGICPRCDGIINRYISIANLEQVQGKLDITMPKLQQHINDSVKPLLNSDFN